MTARKRPFLLIAGLLAGCGGDVEIRPDSRSGEDFERAGAKQLFLDQLTDDYLDGDKGDNTDWKYFKVPNRGILVLTIYWDNKFVDSLVDVRDRFGVLLMSRKHSPELEKDVIEMRVEAGTHFVRMYTPSGASVYTIEGVYQPFDFRSTDEAPPEAVPMGDDILGDPIPDAMPVYDFPPPPGKQGGRKPPPARPGPAAPRPPAAAPAPAGKGVSGTIIRMLPGAGGKTTILTLNIGSGHGLGQGDSGHVLNDDGTPMDGGRLTIQSVSEKSATAQVNSGTGQIGQRRRVKVYVK